jgi:electron transport complex protein RnfC
LAKAFGAAKSALRQRHALELQAGASRERYQQRELRLQRETVERAARETALTRDAASSDAVAAAIERARAKRQQKDSQ